MNQSYVLITGASSGIGESLAYCFAQDGIPLILVARNKAALLKIQHDITKKYGVAVIIYALDLAQPQAAQKLYDLTTQAGLSVGYLVNNAGFGNQADVVDTKVEQLEAMAALNITTLMVLSRLIAADMVRAKQGHIVNLASVAAFIPGPGMAVYYASKAFVLSFSQALTAELGPYGVAVTAICPGPTTTGFAKAAGADKSRLFSGKLPTADQVAAFSYRAIKQRKQVAIWGIGNRIMIRLVGLLPRRIVVAAVCRVQ